MGVSVRLCTAPFQRCAFSQRGRQYANFPHNVMVLHRKPCLKCPLPGLTGNQERSRSERVYCVTRLLSLSVLPVHSTAPRTVGSHCVDNAPRPAALRTHPHLELITGDTEFYFITLITLTCVVCCSHVFDLYIVLRLFLLLSCTFGYDRPFTCEGVVFLLSYS